MKVLITGGAGFIGSNIAKIGMEKGHKLVIYDNLFSGYQENLKGIDATFVNGDIRDEEKLVTAMKGAEVVFHLAAHVGNVRSVNDPILDTAVNVQGTISVLEAMKKCGVSRLAYSSTAAGYGEPVTLPIDEEHPMNPDSPYGVSKIAAEKMVLCYSRLFGWKVTCLRYFNAYGVNQRFDAYGNVIPIFSDRLKRGVPLVIYGDGEQTRDFVNVDDIAEANWLAMEKQLTGYFNIATGQKVSINELIQALENVSGKTIIKDYQSPRKGEVRNSVASIDKAREVLGFAPKISLEAGLAKYWDWFKGI